MPPSTRKNSVTQSHKPTVHLQRIGAASEPKAGRPLKGKCVAGRAQPRAEFYRFHLIASLCKRYGEREQRGRREKLFLSPQKKKEVRENPISRHDDLARSYKGVVINGATDQQGQGRENTDYTGKGKEKMYEEHESKWVKVPEKGGNRYHSYRTNHRGDNGGLRHRSSRFDRSRGYNAEENPRFPREVRRGMSPRVGAAVEAREEGEIPQQEKRQTTRNDQEKTRESVVDPTIILATVQKVTLESQNVENGLDVINDLLEEGNNEVVDDNMVLDENQSNVLGIVEGSDDGFLNLSDGEVEKKKVVRKGLFKQTAVAGASSKARNIQAIISTRKRATNNTKPATRQGEGAKHHEEKEDVLFDLLCNNQGLKLE
ncbi:hypothetical protein Bca4012_075995 [Brassica carinata]